MERTILKHTELNRRVNEVFDLKNHETVWDVCVDNMDNVRVALEDEETEWDYIPNMNERPQALDYILGKRDDFND